MANILTIADLFPDDKGMVLVAKDAADGSFRHISDVDNGGACGCVCIGCGRPLVARNGGDPSIKAHSFAHRPEDVVVDCFSSGETALHIRAKEIIARHCRVTLPATFVTGLDGKEIEVTPERSVALTDVRLETAEGQVVPDVVATMTDGRKLFVEIANSHPCPPDKIEKLRMMGVEAVEIKVARYRGTPLDDLDDIVLDLAPRSMLHSSERADKAAEIAEERRRREAVKVEAAQRLVNVYRDPWIKNHRKAQALVEEMVGFGCADLLDLDDQRPSAFIVYRRQWQAVILDRLYKATSKMLTPMDFLESFAKGNWVKKEIARTTSEHSKWISAGIASEFRSPYEEVYGYLVRLRRQGAVYEVSGRKFDLEYGLRQRIDKQLEERLRPSRQTQLLRDLYGEVSGIVSPQGVAMPDFAHWIAGRAKVRGMTEDELLADAGGRFDDLVEQVEAVKAALEEMAKNWNVDVPDELAGFPVEGLVVRHRIESLDAEERAEAEQAARRRRQEEAAAARHARMAEERVSRLCGEASYALRDPVAFLGTPHPELRGLAPTEIARESPEGLRDALSVLSGIAYEEHAGDRAEELRKDVIARLLERVSYRIPRREVAELWPKQPWKELGGMRPLEYCKDEESLARCLEVLEDFACPARKRRR